MNLETHPENAKEAAWQREDESGSSSLDCRACSFVILVTRAPTAVDDLT